MKLVILGANGRTGRLVVNQALDKGAIITAVVRSAEKQLTVQHENLTCVVGDPTDAAFLAELFHGQDAVISTLGGRKPTHKATSIYPASAEAITTAAWETGLEKVLVISTALLFPSNRLFDRILRNLVHITAKNAAQMERTLKTINLNVVIARCGFLTNKQESTYRSEQGALPERGASISRLGLAQFLVDKAFDTWTGHHVYGVSSPTKKGP